MNNILEPLIPMALIAVWLKIIADMVIRNKLINKGLVDENVKHLFSYNAKTSDIKWGLVLIGIGIAIMAYVLSDLSGEAMFGLMFIFAGVAFMVSHLFSKSSSQK